jgi:hypothetical protein
MKKLLLIYKNFVFVFERSSSYNAYESERLEKFNFKFPKPMKANLIYNLLTYSLQNTSTLSLFILNKAFK